MRGGKQKDKHANSMVVACLKRLLPVGLNVFGGRELDIVQQCKEKFLQKENEDKIRDFIRSLLEIPEKTDPTDKNTWQRNLYKKIGKSQMRGEARSPGSFSKDQPYVRLKEAVNNPFLCFFTCALEAFQVSCGEFEVRLMCSRTRGTRHPALSFG